MLKFLATTENAKRSQAEESSNNCGKVAEIYEKDSEYCSLTTLSFPEFLELNLNFILFIFRNMRN